LIKETHSDSSRKCQRGISDNSVVFPEIYTFIFNKLTAFNMEQQEALKFNIENIIHNKLLLQIIKEDIDDDELFKSINTCFILLNSFKTPFEKLVSQII
jgi:hypothetical protein